jgi:RNA polymerase sigma-70 factor (ECF subfamily)
MSADDSFRDVMARLAAGDHDAAARVFHRFAHRLASLAGVRLGESLRRKLDPEDVLQSVFRSFFSRCAGGEFSFTGWDSLWALLAVMTVRKCNRLHAHYRTAKRNIAAEEPGAADEAIDLAALSREPSAAEVVLLGELMKELLNGRSQRDCVIVSLALQGHDPAEIAAEVGVATRTVYRVLEGVRARLQCKGEGESPAADPGDPSAADEEAG